MRRTRFVVGATVITVGVVVGALLASEGSVGPSSPKAHVSHPVTAAGHGHPTIAAPTGALVPTAPTANSATYGAPSSNYTIDIGASASCWVMATQAPSGKVVWTGTIAAGASQSFSASGHVTVELGAPSDATVSLDGRSVQFPPGFRAPLDLVFQAAS